ncbi:MAG: replicative DNA helicase [Oscillospiraceae bacterium]|nr:replicative DNA helicase [Oscillospiraceae bacterium]
MQLEEQLQAPAPYSLEAEQSVLGSILLDPSCLSSVLEFVNSGTFYRPQHGEIFSIMAEKFVSAQPIDFITVLEEVKARQVFPDESSAKIYLTQLAQSVPTTANVLSYAKIVQEKSYLRSLLNTAKEIMHESVQPQADARELMDLAETRIFDIRKGKETSGLVRIDQVLYDVYDRLQRISSEEKASYVGIPSGFSALDHAITGLNRSDLILLAARPAMGKTSFALNIAANVAKQNHAVAVFSLEMSKDQLVSRLLSGDALIQGSNLRTGELTQDDWNKLAVSAQELSKRPLYIDDTPGISVAEMKAKARRIRDLGLIVIDYLQLMSSGRRTESRVQEVSEITRGLKIMAKELNVPVLTLSQLSRGPDKRVGDHRPMLADLRESGSIEQDADIVMFLYRDEYYNEDSEDRGVAECIIAKNRHGATDTVKLGWDGQFTRFVSRELYRNEP